MIAKLPGGARRQVGVARAGVAPVLFAKP